MLMLGSSYFILTGLAEEGRGLVLSMPCAGCHSDGGKNPSEIPSLSGKSARYIEKKLKAYKNDLEQGTIMNRIAKGYTDEEIQQIATYFERLQQ